MEELHIDSIDGGHEANYGLGHVPGRGRTPTNLLRDLCILRQIRDKTLIDKENKQQLAETEKVKIHTSREQSGK
jgi:hypothetical protein